MAIKQVETQEAVRDNYMTFAMESIARALPDVRDGLKVIHRKIIYKLFQKELFYNKELGKCGTIVGDVLKIHDHSDTAVYEALALLTEQSECLLHPYIIGNGAFGKQYSKDSPSAMRYTSAKLNEFALQMFKDINKNTVKFIGEDKEHLQPLVLPCTYPNILVKPNSGLAVGEKTEFISFNLKEVCETTVAYINDKNIDLLDYLSSPDLSTGGYVIYNKGQFEKICNEGRGSVKLRAKYRFDEENNCIEVYEIPYNTTVDKIVLDISDIIKNNKLKEVIDVRDETGFNKKTLKEELKIAIDIKKNSNINIIMNKLYRMTSLESTISCIFNALVDQKPKVMGIKEILDYWLNFRKECIKRATEYDINKKSEQLHLLKGLEKVLLDIDKAIQIIRHSKSDELIISNLIKEFSIDEQQANDIANMKLKNINEQYILHKIKSIKDLEQEIIELKNTLNNDDKINDIIISQLEEVSKKYGQSRKTTILYEEDIQEISETQLIEEYNTVCYLSKEGYFKKVPATSLRGSTANKLKDGDETIYTTESSNKSTILLFSNKGICFKLYQHEIDDSKLGNLGLYLPQHLQLDKDEQIISMVSTRKYTGYLIVAFNNGKIAKIDMISFKTKAMRSKLDNALNLESPMINMFVIEKDIDIIIKSSIDKVLVSSTSFINSKASKNTAGNQVQKQKNDSVTDLCVPLSQIDNECIDVDYYKSESGKGIGNYLRRTEEIKLLI